MGKLRLSASQYAFINEMPTKFKGFIGGFGSGKTYVGCTDLGLFATQHPKTVQGFWGTTYPSIRDVFYPTMDEAAYPLGIKTKVKVGDREVELYRGRKWMGQIICRSMDNPGSIVGYKVVRGLCDELDTLNKEKAKDAWRKMIARLRLKVDGVQNTLGVTTTPEGFRFVYDMFADEPTESYSMVQASTYENEQYLPEDYISSLIETYPSQLIDAYIKGDFVNLTSGSVYPSFCRKLNASTETLIPGENVYIGMDFNVGKMSGIVHVLRNGIPHAVEEILGSLDTPAIIQTILQRYKNRGHYVNIYPDSSGKNRKSVNASQTDISLLQAAGFRVHYTSVNPAVRDRIVSMNTAFCNAKGERKYFVSANGCPQYTKDLEQQVYNKNGEPDKQHDTDHTPDAGGYLIYSMYPVVKPVAQGKLRWNM